MVSHKCLQFLKNKNNLIAITVVVSVWGQRSEDTVELVTCLRGGAQAIRLDTAFLAEPSCQPSVCKHLTHILSTTFPVPSFWKPCHTGPFVTPFSFPHLWSCMLLSSYPLSVPLFRACWCFLWRLNKWHDSCCPAGALPIAFLPT